MAVRGSLVFEVEGPAHLKYITERSVCESDTLVEEAADRRFHVLPKEDWWLGLSIR